MTPRRMMWRLLTYRPWLSLAALGTWLLISSVPVVLGLVARAFFDRLSAGAPAAGGLWWLVALPIGVHGVRLAVTWFTVPLNVVHRFTTTALLNRNMLEQILRRPGAAALPFPPGDVANRFRDDADEVAAFLSIIYLLSAVGEILTAAVSLAVMLSINALVTLSALAPLLAVALLVRAANRRTERYRSASRTAAGAVTGALGEMFGAVQAIQLAGAEARVAARVGALNDRRRVAAVQDTLFSEVLRSISFNTANLGTGIVLIVAAQAMRANTFTVGDFALFAAYLSRVTLVTGVIGDTLARYRQSVVSLERMQALITGTPPGALTAHAPAHLDGPLPDIPHPHTTPADRLERLEVHHLTCLHPDSGRGVRDISFQVERGQFVAITGRVGSGKTTLLRALLGLLPHQSGAIRWNNSPVPDPATHFVPPRCAYTPQVPTLFSGTLEENILLGAPGTAAALQTAVHSAALEPDVASFPEGLQTLVGPRGVKLSGGQAQRTAAARMLIRNPQLLVFDDLSSALDTQTEHLLWSRLRDRPDTTCLAVTHRRAALEAADHIIVLKEGQIAAQGPLNDLLTTSPDFQAIWTGQEPETA